LYRGRNRAKALAIAHGFRKRHPLTPMQFIGNPDDPNFKGQFLVLRKDRACKRQVSFRR